MEIIKILHYCTMNLTGQYAKSAREVPEVVCVHWVKCNVYQPLYLKPLSTVERKVKKIFESYRIQRIAKSNNYNWSKCGRFLISVNDLFDVSM